MKNLEIIKKANDVADEYQIYVNGVLDVDRTSQLNSLIAQKQQQQVAYQTITFDNFLENFSLYNELFNLTFEEDWLSNTIIDRATLLSWLEISRISSSRLIKIIREVKAGNKLLFGLNLTNDEYQILHRAKYFAGILKYSRIGKVKWSFNKEIPRIGTIEFSDNAMKYLVEGVPPNEKGIVITDKKEIDRIVSYYSGFLMYSTSYWLELLAKKKGAGEEGVGVSFKGDLDEYDMYQLPKLLDDHHVLAELYAPIVEVDEIAYLDFETFYDYVAKTVQDILEEEPERTELIPLLMNVKKSLGLDS
ncbi:hypothetical protein [Xylocopilactobacillus apicola]|uniref:hypothetical protein n=1 Tax=Xylocopilactobacillus apicola TaxID=2932184 RepID=UPI002953A785|nr:hypothetical protein [Xylocopilactobacillus apicola]